MSHTIFHTQLCHTQSFTHHLSHTALSHTIFRTPCFTHIIFHTQLCHTPSFLHLLLCLSFLPRPRYNISGSLLEEVDLWGYPVYLFIFRAFVHVRFLHLPVPQSGRILGSLRQGVSSHDHSVLVLHTHHCGTSHNGLQPGGSSHCGTDSDGLSVAMPCILMR